MGEQKKRFDLGTFNGEESIDRREIIITNHAIDRYNGYLRLKTPVVDSPAHKKARVEIQKLLANAAYKNAASPHKRLDTIRKYGEQQYFFRNGHWQFVVAHDKENLGNFILKTIIWLNEAQYQHCFQ